MEIGRSFCSKGIGIGKDRADPGRWCERGSKRRDRYARAVWISPYQRCILPEHLASTVSTIQTGLNGPRSKPRPRSLSQISGRSAVAQQGQGGR